MSSNIIRIYAPMVADLFHRGHVEFLRAAKSIVPGETYLIIGLYSDVVTESYKRKPIFSLEDRAVLVRACRYVDEVIVGAPLVVTEKFLDEYRIDYFVHGDDLILHDALVSSYKVAFDRGIMKCPPYYEGISTTSIIRKICDAYQKSD